MAIKNIRIDKMTTEKIDKNNTTEGGDNYDVSSATLKKKVGFKVTNDKGDVYIVDKWLTIVDGKTDEDYSKEAYELCKDGIEEWDNGFVNVGKTFNPETGKIE